METKKKGKRRRWYYQCNRMRLHRWGIGHDVYKPPLLDWARGSGSLILSFRLFFYIIFFSASQEFIQLFPLNLCVIFFLFLFSSRVLTVGAGQDQQQQQQQQDPAVVAAAATAAAAANALSAMQREERSRILRERQNEERQRKLEELKQHVIIIICHFQCNAMHPPTHSLIGLFKCNRICRLWFVNYSIDKQRRLGW